MILAIDTSGKNLGLALCHDGKIEASSLTRPGLKHGEILQDEIAGFLKKNDIAFGDLTGSSVTIGPGSFTGLRIGLAAAKGYAYALKIPLAGISTLLASAGHFKNISRPVMPVINARRQEFYYALFDCSGQVPKRLTPDAMGKLPESKESIKEDTIIFGSSELQEQLVAEFTCCDYHISDNFNLAGPAGLWGERKIIESDVLDLATAVPVYVRSGI
jgi:tRNA threonylcarbamoyladenosine biosynthesis protein TsaB